MMDFTHSELILRSLLSYREREATALAKAPKASHIPHSSLRAAVAAELVRIARCLDRETADALFNRETHTAGRGS